METQERTGSFFRFEDLRIYTKSNDYSVWLLENLRAPKTEAEQNLSNAFYHSAFDIALNIAEGSSRNKSQFEHYLKISKTAIRECIVYTTLAKGLNMLTDEEVERSRELLMEMTRMIGALIISLQRGSHRRDDEKYREEDNGSDDNIDELDSIDTNF